MCNKLRVGLASSSTGPTVSGDPHDASNHSTKSSKLPYGTSPDNCSLVVVFRPPYRKVQRQLAGKKDMVL